MQALVDDKGKFHNLELFQFVASFEKTFTTLTSYQKHVHFVSGSGFVFVLGGILGSPVFLVEVGGRLRHKLFKLDVVTLVFFLKFEGGTGIDVSKVGLVDEVIEALDLLDQGVSLFYHLVDAELSLDHLGMDI